MFVSVEQKPKQENIILGEILPSKYMIGGQFDTATFNTDFIKVIDQQEILAEKIERDKLKQINDYYIKRDKYKFDQKNDLSELSISDILFNWQNNIKNIIIEIFQFNYTIEDFFYIFTKENRMFYIGLTFIFVGLVGYFINNYILNDKNNIVSKIKHHKIKTNITQSKPKSNVPKADSDISTVESNISKVESNVSKVESNISKVESNISKIESDVSKAKSNAPPKVQQIVTPPISEQTKILNEVKQGGKILQSPMIFGFANNE